MRRIIATAVIAIALVCSFVAGAVIQGDIMPAQAASVSCSAKIVSVQTVPAGVPIAKATKFFVNYDNGVGYEFDSIEQANRFCLEMQTTQNAERLALARWMALDDDLSNQNVMVGKTLIFDLSANNPVSIR